jgi:hypothetical protein
MGKQSEVTSGFPSDVKGVGQLKLASLTGLIGQTLIWVVGLPVYIWLQLTTNSASKLGSNLGPGINTIPGWNNLNWFYLSLDTLTVGFILSIGSFVFFYLGFRAVNRSIGEFRAPNALLFVGLVGYALLAVTSLIFAGAMASAISSAGPGAIASGSAALNMSAIWAGVVLISLGGFFGILGTIGLVLGNRRAGRRFADSKLTVGAILTMFPFLAIAGQGLLLQGYSRKPLPPPKSGGPGVERPFEG